MTFARRFGSVQVHGVNQYRSEGYPEIYYLSTLARPAGPAARVMGSGALGWFVVESDTVWENRR